MTKKSPDFIEYPKWLYHRRHGSRIFKSANETKWLWLFGWKEKPFLLEKPGVSSAIKICWLEWEWLFKASGVLIGVVGAVIALLKVL